MGMPACTITSQTAHGGIVVVGFPTVLIGMMPASRIGDNHVCPMVTGVVPHVGGPFILGSPTVLVGNMPQSRVTDQLVCVGPPDVAVMGCETVLVGMAGAGGAAGAAGGIAAMGASVPMQAPSAAAQLKAELQSDGTIKTSAPPGTRLPPIALQQPGWPDLPASEAPNFESAQPITLPPGAPMYRVIPSEKSASGAYWTPWLPDTEEVWRSGCAVEKDFNSDGKVAIFTVPPGPGVKVWMGRASHQATYGGGGMQYWLPRGTIKPDLITPTPWAERAGI